MDRWAHLGHKLGECFYCGSTSATYVHIPKNASSYIKAYLLSTKDWFHCEKLQHNEQYIVALRDPVERWISGMAQYQVNSQQFDLSEDEIFSTITFDDHTEEQIYFLTGVNLLKTTFFKVDDTLADQLDKYFAGRVDITRLTRYNDSNDDSTKLNLKHRLQAMIDNTPAHLVKLKEHFARDYELINRVKFYGTR